MEYFFTNQIPSVICSLFAGIIIAVVYDVFLVKREVLFSGRYARIFEDTLFCLVAFCFLTVFILKSNYGRYRWYELIFAYISFYIYRRSVGAFGVHICSCLIKFLAKIIFRIVDWFFILPCRRVCAFFGIMIDYFQAAIRKVILINSSKLSKRRIEKTARHGFEIK